MSAPVRIRCRFFARYAEVLGTDEVMVSVAAPADVAAVVRRVRADLPSGALLPERPLVAVNREHAGPDRRVADGDEVAFLPPLAGG